MSWHPEVGVILVITRLLASRYAVALAQREGQGRGGNSLVVLSLPAGLLATEFQRALCGTRAGLSRESPSVPATLETTSHLHSHVHGVWTSACPFSSFFMVDISLPVIQAPLHPRRYILEHDSSVVVRAAREARAARGGGGVGCRSERLPWPGRRWCLSPPRSSRCCVSRVPPHAPFLLQASVLPLNPSPTSNPLPSPFP